MKINWICIIFLLFGLLSVVLEATDTIGVVFSYDILPDSFITVRVAGYEISETISDPLTFVRTVFSYDILPDSSCAFRVAGYEINGSVGDVYPLKRTVFSFDILPDSIIACRLAGYKCNSSSEAPSPRYRCLYGFSINPDSLLTVRLAGYKINGSSEITPVRSRWVFSYAFIGSLTVIVMTEPYGGEITVDGAPPVFCDTIRGLVADAHSIAVLDSIQRVFDDRYWFTFTRWVTSFGDTLYEPSLDIALPGENATYKAYFDYSPTASSILKDQVWFDPYGRKRSFRSR